MKDVLDDIDRWRQQGRRVALATVVEVKGSGPRDPGATMAISEDGEVAGSVSGGCVESAVVSAALEVLASGRPRLCSFGYSDDEALAVGLTCGGTISVFVDQLDGPSPGGDAGTAGGDAGTALFDALRQALRAGAPVALATVVDCEPGVGGDALGPGARVLVRPDLPVTGTLGDPSLDTVVTRDANGALAAGRCALRHYGPHGEARQQAVSVFVETFGPPPRMVIFGAVDFSAALAELAKVLGYQVTVCDARAVFATRARFPAADEVVAEWPDRYLERHGAGLGPRDVVCVLTHDTKFDVPAIVGALRTAAGYIGAMGSRRTTELREARLRQAGVSDEELARVHAPIGLDIGARTPEETAVAICAEIIALRTGTRAVASLRDGSGPIHRDAGHPS